jgi:ABC-2 type transport system ATP-binding protein
VHELRVDGGGGEPVRVHLQLDPQALNATLLLLTGAGVHTLVSRPPTLEELFLRHYQTTEDDDARASTR